MVAQFLLCAASGRCGLLVAAIAVLGFFGSPAGPANSAIAREGGDSRGALHWIGTWGTAPQAALPGRAQTLAKQTRYVSGGTGDSTGAVKFSVAQTITDWPFLTGVDVAASSHGGSIVALGSSLTDGDGSTTNANRRWPDVLAERLQKDADGNKELGVLNE